jgi:Tol biopolymer transport system component
MSEPSSTATWENPRLLWVGVGLLVLSVGALLWVYYTGMEPGAPPSVFPLTSFVGNEVEPALSPDGERVVFAWDGGTGGPFQLYVQAMDSPEPEKINLGSAEARLPVWSPDGTEIAFLRRAQGGNSEVLVVPATGGSERRITTVTDTYFRGIDWSPDGRTLALVDKNRAGDRESIWLISMSDGSRRKVSTPPSAGSGDRAPRFSGDGRRRGKRSNVGGSIGAYTRVTSGASHRSRDNPP